MTDIVWSLRNDVPCNGDIGCSYELCNQAADEITRLRAEVAWHVEDKNAWQDTQAAHLREVTRLIAEVDSLKSMVIAQEKLLRSKDAENEKLRAALEEIIKRDDEWVPEAQDDYSYTGYQVCADIARAALEEK
jgi:hypothetical protein